MTPGPLRRLIGTVGLFALAPTALMLALDQITPLDAALRGGATLAAAIVIGRLAGWWVMLMARGLEAPPAEEPAAGSSQPQPQRRRGDGGELASTGS